MSQPGKETSKTYLRLFTPALTSHSSTYTLSRGRLASHAYEKKKKTLWMRRAETLSGVEGGTKGEKERGKEGRVGQ